MGSMSYSKEKVHHAGHKIAASTDPSDMAMSGDSHEIRNTNSSLPDHVYSLAIGVHSYYQELDSKPGTSFDAEKRIIVSCNKFPKLESDGISRECSVSLAKFDEHEVVRCCADSRNSTSGNPTQIEELHIVPPCSRFKPHTLAFSHYEAIVKSTCTVENLVKWKLRNSSNSSKNAHIDVECVDNKLDLKNIGKGLAYLYYENDLRWRLIRINNPVGCHRFQNILPFVVIDCSETALSLRSGESRVLNPVGWIATNVQLESNLTFSSQVFSVVLDRNAEQISHVVIHYPEHLVTLKHLLKDGLITVEEYKMEFKNFISTLFMILRDQEPNYTKTCSVFEGSHSLEEHIQEFYHNLQKGNNVPNDDGIENDLEEDGPNSGFEQNYSNLRGSCQPVSQDFIAVSTDPVEDEWNFSENLSDSVCPSRNAVLPLTHKMIVAALRQSNHINDEAVRLLTNEDSRTNHQQNGLVLQVLLFLISSVVVDYTAMVKSFSGIRQRAEASRGRDEEFEMPTVSSSTVTSADGSSDLKHEKSKTKSTKLPPEPKRAETRSQVMANILFTMIEDKKYFPYDFEVLLRSLVFEQKQEVCKLRNKDGLSLMHAIAVSVRPQLLLPLFRTGCWSDLRTLSAEKGPYEGKTVEDICTDAKSRKLQKEMDTYTKWEKSLNQVHISARKGNFSEFKKTMKFSEDLHHEVDEMGCTSLYWAVVGGNMDILKLLLSKKVDHTKVNYRQETLLHVACMIGHRHLLATLVKHLKMDWTVKDAAKKSALLRIAENGDEKSLSEMMDCGLKKEELGQMMAIAGHYGRLSFIKKLIDDYGTDPGSKDEVGKTAFMRACEQSRIDVAKYLLSKGVDVTETDIRRRSVLHMATDGATVEMMEFLLNRIKEKGETVLKQMIDHRDKYIGGELCMLIRGKDKGRDSWHYVEVSRGLMDVFMKKTRSGTIDVAKYGSLLHSGWGIDPDEESVKEIERRFEIRRNAQQFEDLDVTPLHIAAFKDKEDVAEVLVRHGSNVNSRDKFGLTPLHIAAMRGNMSLVKLLMKRGADHEALDNLVKTPVDVAEDNEHKEVANFIRSCQHLPVAQNFRTTVLPNIQQLLSDEYIQELLDSGSDVRTHLINTLRDLTIDINESLLALGSGPVLEESAPNQFGRNEIQGSSHK